MEVCWIVSFLLQAAAPRSEPPSWNSSFSKVHAFAFLDINEDIANELSRRIEATGRHDPLYLACDLTNIPALKIAVDEVNRRLGSPVVLVNNAGSDDRHDLGSRDG